MVSCPFAECHLTEQFFAECHFAERHFAECQIAYSCHFAKCPKPNVKLPNLQPLALSSLMCLLDLRTFTSMNSLRVSV